MAIKKNFSSAEYLYNNNDLENAKKICQSILIENDENLNAINLIIDINIKQEKFDEALKYINVAINADTLNFKPYFKKSLVLQKLKKSEEALQSADKAISLNNKHPEIFNLKGIIHENLNEDKKALESWNRAILIKENYA